MQDEVQLIEGELVESRPVINTSIISFSSDYLGMTDGEASAYAANVAATASAGAQARRVMAEQLRDNSHLFIEALKATADIAPDRAVALFIQALGKVAPELPNAPTTAPALAQQTNQSINIFSDEQAAAILSTLQQKPKNP